MGLDIADWFDQQPQPTRLERELAEAKERIAALEAELRNSSHRGDYLDNAIDAARQEQTDG